jgi:hypothetical protein
MDHCLTAHDIHSGQTDLHFVNELLQELTRLHITVEKGLRSQKQHKLIQTSKRLYYLHKKINKQPNDHPAMTQDKEEYNELQRELQIDAEILETAKQMRIQNFYKSKNGKLNLVSFQSVKEKHPSRNIDQLYHNNETITDPERIIQVMQEWYAHTAESDHLQTETLPDFLNEQQLELPQISLEYQDMLVEEITPNEVENAINEAKEMSAPGPSGHTITLYKLLFQEIPNIFTFAINQLVFNNELAGHHAFQWIKYIPKKPNPIAPGDFRPLSMWKFSTRYHPESLLRDYPEHHYWRAPTCIHG